MRLIDTNALKKAIGDLYGLPFEEMVENFTWLKAIDNAPTVNPYFPFSEEAIYKITDAEWEHSDNFWITTPSGKKIEFEKKRPQGEWIATKYYSWACSKCAKNPTMGMGYVQNHKELFDFCPNCGAKMKVDSL